MDILRTPEDRFSVLPDYPFAPNYVEVEADDGDRLRIRLHATHEAGARPRDVLAALGWDDDLESGVWALERTQVELQP